jgi:hypothetical protein
VLPSPFAVTTLAVEAVEDCARAAAELGEARGRPLPVIGVDTRAVAAAVSSERHLRIAGERPVAWAPLSGFFAARDGWVRLHGNYPHHAAANSRALSGADGVAAVREAVAERAAADVEAAVVAAGGVAAAVRSSEAWRHSAEGAAAAAAPLVERRATGAGRTALPGVVSPVGAPASGLRVLDLTRVLAGPVAGRSLALWGAEVLRIDPPDRPEIAAQHVDMDAGKYSSRLDLRDPTGAERMRALAADADVVLLGYRPGALASLGLGADDLLTDAPHLVVVELSAWGWTGPWAERRGFDSIVQAACGIAERCAAPDGAPGALPAQVLDHATGYRAAAAALRGLAARPARGGVRLRLSLAAAAAELIRLGVSGAGLPSPQDTGYDPALYVRTDGEVTTVRPPFTLDGVTRDYPFPARPYGADAPRWRDPAS